MPSHLVFLRSIIILLSHLSLNLPSGLFRFPHQNSVCISHLYARDMLQPFCPILGICKLKFVSESLVVLLSIGTNWRVVDIIRQVAEYARQVREAWFDIITWMRDRRVPLCHTGTVNLDTFWVATCYCLPSHGSSGLSPVPQLRPVSIAGPSVWDLGWEK